MWKLFQLKSGRKKEELKINRLFFLSFNKKHERLIKKQERHDGNGKRQQRQKYDWRKKGVRFVFQGLCHEGHYSDAENDIC